MIMLSTSTSRDGKIKIPGSLIQHGNLYIRTYIRMYVRTQMTIVLQFINYITLHTYLTFEYLYIYAHMYFYNIIFNAKLQIYMGS